MTENNISRNSVHNGRTQPSFEKAPPACASKCMDCLKDVSNIRSVGSKFLMT